MAPKYVNQTLGELKGEIDNSTIVVGDLNTPLSIMVVTQPNMQNSRIHIFLMCT